MLLVRQPSIDDRILTKKAAAAAVRMIIELLNADGFGARLQHLKTLCRDRPVFCSCHPHFVALREAIVGVVSARISITACQSAVPKGRIESYWERHQSGIHW